MFGSEHRGFDPRVWLFGEIIATCLLGLVFYFSTKTEQPASSRQCRQTLRSLEIAGRLYACEHNNHYPASLIEMRREVNNPRVLLCPSVSKSKAPASWDPLTQENITYEVVTPGLSATDIDYPFLCCPIHGYVVFADGRLERRQ